MDYFDTSIIASYYCPEASSFRAEEALLSSTLPVISRLTSTEMASALSRKVREKTLTRLDAHKIWIKFDHHITEGYYKILPLEDRHFWLASEILTRFDTALKTLDALHLVIAYEAEARLVTDDAALAKACKIVGVKYKTLGSA